MSDIVIVGAGLFGAVCAYELRKAGYHATVIEKDNHPGGLLHDEWRNGILVHLHGPHIFQTNSRRIWEYVNDIAEFRPWYPQDLSFHQGKPRSFPINLWTLYQYKGITTPEEAESFFRTAGNAENLEDWAIERLGRVLYDTFIAGYTRKMWGRDPKDLPSSIIQRIPIYAEYCTKFSDKEYQGLPVDGYSAFIERLLDGIDVQLSTPYDPSKNTTGTVIYSGSPDELFKYTHGTLEYRTIDFEFESFDKPQIGAPWARYPDETLKYTRKVEYRYWMKNPPLNSIVVTEYPREWCSEEDTRMYPIPTERNLLLASRYKVMAEKYGYFLGGRLGSYQYMNMDQVIAQALTTVEKVKKWQSSFT